jgi:prolipoprotein diacylglyceryltransferase
MYVVLSETHFLFSNSTFKCLLYVISCFIRFWSEVIRTTPLNIAYIENDIRVTSLRLIMMITGCLVQISAGTSTTLTEDIRGLHQNPQEYSRVVP